MGNCLSAKEEECKKHRESQNAAPPIAASGATGKENLPAGNATTTNTNKPSGSAPAVDAAKPASAAAPTVEKPPRGDINLTRVFGVTIAISSEHSGGGVPSPITETCRWIKKNGLAHEGLFRIPGRALTVKNWIEEFNYDPATVIPDNESVDNVTSLIINYFKQVKNGAGKKGFIWESPDGAYNLQKELQLLRKSKQQPDANWVKDALSHLSAPQIGIFRELTSVLHAASTDEYMEKNRMNPYNFSMCTLPTIMAAVEIMIEEHDFVFGDEGPESPAANRRAKVNASEAKLAAVMNDVIENEHDSNSRPSELLSNVGSAQHAVSQEQ